MRAARSFRRAAHGMVRITANQCKRVSAIGKSRDHIVNGIGNGISGAAAVEQANRTRLGLTDNQRTGVSAGAEVAAIDHYLPRKCSVECRDIAAAGSLISDLY